MNPIRKVTLSAPVRHVEEIWLKGTLLRPRRHLSDVPIIRIAQPFTPFLREPISLRRNAKNVVFQSFHLESLERGHVLTLTVEKTPQNLISLKKLVNVLNVENNCLSVPDVMEISLVAAVFQNAVSLAQSKSLSKN